MLMIEQCMNELNQVMKNAIEDTLKIADKYELDRDGLIKQMGEKMYLTTEIGTFKNYELKS